MRRTAGLVACGLQCVPREEVLLWEWGLSGRDVSAEELELTQKVGGHNQI